MSGDAQSGAQTDDEPSRGETACRFCGLAVRTGQWHRECVSSVGDGNGPEPFHGHPMYGPRPGPYFIQQG